LKSNNILFDARAFGIRLSPHIYNTKEEMEKVADLITALL
jgi:selenocysteine lyase/cysteine desulfurase